MLRIRFLLASLGLLAALWCAAGRADDDPPKGPPKAPARLTSEALGEMLANMGYEPKLEDKKFHKIEVASKGASWKVWVSAEDDGQTVQLLGMFYLRSDCDHAPPEAWRKLLEKNDEIGPAAFGYEAKTRRLTLRKPLAAGVTPAQLRKEFTAFADTIEKTQPLWRPAAFLPPPTAAARKLLDQLTGTWVPTAATLEGKAASPENLAKIAVAFEKNQLQFFQDGQEKAKAILHVAVGDGPTTIDMINDAGTDLGIVKLDKETLTLCYVVPASGAPRPAEFVSTAKNKATLLVFSRKKP